MRQESRFKLIGELRRFLMTSLLIVSKMQDCYFYKQLEILLTLRQFLFQKVIKL